MLLGAIIGIGVAVALIIVQKVFKVGNVSQAGGKRLDQRD